MALLFSLLLLTAHAEDLWPSHQGHIVEDIETQAYLDRVFNQESKPLKSWLPTNEHATDVCGVLFQVALQHRSSGPYVVVLAQSADKKAHVVKWPPMGYRFDGGVFQRLTPYKPVTEVRAGGYQYLYSMRFPYPEQLAMHGTMQLYLPWVDKCPSKLSLDYVRTAVEDADWSTEWKRNLSIGAHFSMWGAVSLHLTSFSWLPHGWDVEAQSVFMTGGLGFAFNASYAFALSFARYYRLVPKVGYRSLYPYLNKGSIGVGAEVDFVWEVPGTRSRESGQRLLFEAGCGARKLFSDSASASSGHCRIGIGLGW